MKDELLLGITYSASYSEVKTKVSIILKKILSGDALINEFYLHPLGFYYCRLFADKTKQLRLHFWEKGYQKKDDLFIHDHFYDLCSWLLCGQIVDYIYEVKETDHPSLYSLFTSSYLKNPNIRTLNKTNQYMTIKLAKRRLINKGDKYFIPKGSFHSNDVVFDNSDLTFTCVCTYNHKDNNSPNVIGLTQNENYSENDPVRLSETQVKLLIEKVLLYL